MVESWGGGIKMNNLINFIMVPTIVTIFLIVATVLAYNNHDIARFW